MIAIATYSPEHFAGVDALWQTAFPDDPIWNRAAVAIPAKRAMQPELFLVATDGALVAGTIMAGYDGHRGWLYALAVLPSHRHHGIAKRLVDEAMLRLGRLGCKKVNLQVRKHNEAATAFWRAMGFAVEERVSMGRGM
jgi:ribosomal protein S18 acetylase RimI-like enzyme